MDKILGLWQFSFLQIGPASGAMPSPIGAWLEDLSFLIISTLFLVTAGYLWREAEPFSLPQPLPTWFGYWLRLVLVAGLLLPLGALIWGSLDPQPIVVSVLLPYFAMLGLQIAAEILALRRFQSCVWVLVPCVYLPYRIWQLHRGWTIAPEPDLLWLRWLLAGEMGLWIFNYFVHLSQIPRLLRWGGDGIENAE